MVGTPVHIYLAGTWFSIRMDIPADQTACPAGYLHISSGAAGIGGSGAFAKWLGNVAQKTTQESSQVTYVLKILYCP